MGKRGFHSARPRRTERSRILVVTEGVITEVQYLEGLAQFLRATGVSIRGVRPKGIGKDPLKVLEAAVELYGADDGAYDSVWVVVDVDDHTTLDEALRDAGSRDIPIVVSNPCFEVWLLWHYEDCAAHQDRKGLQRKLSTHGHQDKNVPAKFPYGQLADALRRGTKVAVSHGVKGPNPSSAMPALIVAIQR